MSLARLWAYLLLTTLATAAPAVAGDGPFEIAVRTGHMRHGSEGTLALTDQGVEYRTAKAWARRSWTYRDVKQIEVVSPTRIIIRTYQDRGWWQLWTDRSVNFELLRGTVSPEWVAFLLAKTSRPVVTAVLPPMPGSPRYSVAVKHVRGRKGTEGELLLYENALVYKTARPDASRYWHFGDLAAVYAPNPFRLEVLAYEGGAGDTRPFNFQLQNDLPAGFFDALWAAINAPAPLKGGR